MPRKPTEKKSTSPFANPIQKPKYIDDNRKRINSLWKRKKGLLKKAFYLAKCCEQNVILTIYDPRLRRMTHFQSSAEFGLTELIKQKEKKTVKVKKVLGDDIVKDLGAKYSCDMETASENDNHMGSEPLNPEQVSTDQKICIDS